MKLCTDCKWLWLDPDWHDRKDAEDFSECRSPHLRIDPSTGRVDAKYASLQREGFYSLWGLNGCGPWGFWWEGKEA